MTDAERIAYLEAQLRERDAILVKWWGYFVQFGLSPATDKERNAVSIKFDRILRRLGILPAVTYSVDEAGDPPMPPRAEP